jgi:type IV secretory pathway VirB2 component (pilin)
MKPLRALVLPAALLALAQVWHAVTPANNVDPTTQQPIEGGYVGLVGGLLLLIGCIVASLAARRGKEWSRPLSLVCGVGVAGGFLLYHATTLRSPVTNPYFGVDGIGPVQLAPVIACMAIGAWLAWTAWPLKAEGRVRAAA